MIIFLPLLACAPEPASIVFDGGGATVTVHGVYSIPVRHATVLDEDGKAIDPQPRVRWGVDNTDVVTLEGETLTPRNHGVAKIEASVGEVRANYTLRVDPDGKESATAKTNASRSACPVTDFSNGVYVFGCDKSGFPYALAEFVGTHHIVVSAVTPLIDYRDDGSSVSAYLVITRPNE